MITNLRIPSLKLTSWLWVTVALCLAPSLHPAKAYLDPGTGSYMIQMAIGIVFGGAYTIKRFLGAAYKKMKDKNNNDKTVE